MKIYVYSLVLSSIITLILGRILLPILKRLKFGQPILGYVSEHKQKNGTPTMGGLFFVVGAIACYLVLGGGESRLSNLTIAVTLAFLSVGFLDDFLKIKFSHNEGLKAWQKFSFQVIISLIASYFAYNTGLNFIYLPFTKTQVSLGIFTVILNSIVFVATVNSVNLTDGLDGLCASVSAVAFIAFAIIITLQTNSFSIYINDSEYRSLSLYLTCFTGALLGYLVYNTNKASVFMGDTGSLAIGGALSTVAVLSGNVLYIPIIGVFYLLSSLSVIIQVIKFKRTGKRVFLMAPLHHHFQEKGHSESKITYVYTFVTLLISLLCIAIYL